MLRLRVPRALGRSRSVEALHDRQGLSHHAKTLDDLDDAARDMHTWAKSQRMWLDEHPPQACYADAHAQWRKGVVDVREAAKDVRRAIEQLRAAPMERAVRRLVKSARQLTSVDFGSVTEACVRG